MGPASDERPIEVRLLKVAVAQLFGLTYFPESDEADAIGK